MYLVQLRGSCFRYIYRTGLWKVIGFAYPREFLQGVFDGDGAVTISIHSNPLEFRPVIELSNSNLELLKFVNWLLKKNFNIESKVRQLIKRGEVAIIKGKRCTLKDCWELNIQNKENVKKFFKHVGYRIQRKQEKLKDAVEILQKYKSNSERVKAWLEKYVKVNGRWVKRSDYTLTLPQTTPTN